MSLVKESLKLWSLYMAYYMPIFLLKNVSSFCISFFSKNTCEFSIIHTRTANILTTNELNKLTMFWTTGPRSTFCHFLQGRQFFDFPFALLLNKWEVQSTSETGVYSMGKQFAPCRCKFFPYRVDSARGVYATRKELAPCGGKFLPQKAIYVLIQ